jgi:protein farnesyltransferase/geranylgeranyltransferase type-1 subunit alpha
LGDSSHELAFVEQILNEDSKNYHAWGYRQWVLSRFGLWEGELEFISRLLREDVRNNSAWNQRFFVLQATADLASPALLAAEAEFAESHIERAPSNPSPWNYLRGLLEPVGYDAVPRVRAMCEERAAAGSSPPGSEGGRVMAMGLLVDVLLASGSKEELERARALCQALGEMDPIRAAYWSWRGFRVGA